GPGVHQVQVADYLLVVDQLVERVLGIQLFACLLESLDNLDWAVGELADFPLPLVLDGCRGDDEHAADAALPDEQLDRGHRLWGFAESHIVAEDASAAAGEEGGAAHLEVVERELEQMVQRRFCSFEIR